MIVFYLFSKNYNQKFYKYNFLPYLCNRIKNKTKPRAAKPKRKKT